MKIATETELTFEKLYFIDDSLVIQIHAYDQFDDQTYFLGHIQISDTGKFVKLSANYDNLVTNNLRHILETQGPLSIPEIRDIYYNRKSEDDESQDLCIIKEKETQVDFIVDTEIDPFSTAGYLIIRLVTYDVYDNGAFDIGHIRLREDGTLVSADIEGFAHFAKELDEMLDTRKILKYNNIRNLFNTYLAELNKRRLQTLPLIANDIIHNTNLKASNIRRLSSDEIAQLTGFVEYNISDLIKKYGVDTNTHPNPAKFSLRVHQLLTDTYFFDNVAIVKEPTVDEKGFIAFRLTNKNRFTVIYALDLELK